MKKSINSTNSKCNGSCDSSEQVQVPIIFEYNESNNVPTVIIVLIVFIMIICVHGLIFTYYQLSFEQDTNINASNNKTQSSIDINITHIAIETGSNYLAQCLMLVYIIYIVIKQYFCNVKTKNLIKSITAATPTTTTTNNHMDTTIAKSKTLKEIEYSMNHTIPILIKILTIFMILCCFVIIVLYYNNDQLQQNQKQFVADLFEAKQQQQQQQQEHYTIIIQKANFTSISNKNLRSSNQK
jgi:hypothetical protein